MATNETIWQAPPLSAEDAALIDAYATIGRSWDELPHTPDFRRLMDLLQRPHDDDHMHYVFRRLLTLRKRGQLPRLNSPASMD
ncbi:MAG TPA: hypothetical protein VET25_08080 [Aestuariivirgaceae bacterium]|nr:hypothetical protein [Aestuariivirgaceae bacterium]